MTRLYTIDGKLIFDEPDLTLKEAVKKHKDNLVGADLDYADLSGANLEGANLFKAILSGANLEGVDLSNADY